MTIVKELDLLENKEVREEMLGKIEVLDKVKELLLLPGTELMTTKIVAEYFEVGLEAVKTLYNRNKEELEMNGAKTIKSTELRQLKTEVQDATLLGRANAVTTFSKRAVLNVAMLLRDSHVAKRVRAALLDQQEIISDEQKIKGVTDEQLLLLAIIQASTPVEQAIAVSEYDNYKNRHIAQLNVRIDEMKPKEDAYNSFIKAENAQKFNEVGKVLGIGQNKLISFLRDKKVIMKSNGRNIPYQSFIERGLFIVKEGTKEINGNSINYATTYVTAKGIDAISKLLKKSNLI